jgi:DNA-binding NtrC family response regulator
MNGFELIRLVHAERPGLPVILITGQLDVLKGSLPTGARHYRLFTKPLNGPDFLSAITDARGGAG